MAQVVGMVSLKDLVNGQALSSQAAFHVEGGEEGVSVEALLAEVVGEGVGEGQNTSGLTETAYSKVFSEMIEIIHS